MKNTILKKSILSVYVGAFLSINLFAQSPTVINDSLVVNNRLYAKEKLIVDLEAKFKEDIKVLGTARLLGNLIVSGVATFENNVKMTGLGTAAALTPNSEVIFILPNGQLKKGTIGALGVAAMQQPLDLNYCAANGGIAQWWAGLNKLFTACPDVKVGIRTNDPQFALHVAGTAYTQKLLVGNSGGSTNALINGYVQNSSDDLFELGVKIGGGESENRFRIKNDGTVYAKEIRIRAVQEFPDYVFKENYYLMNLSDLKLYISQNGHLPNMPTSAEVEAKGIAMGDLTIKLVEKVEELTLYCIELNELNLELKEELHSQSEEIDLLKKEILEIKDLINN